MQSDQHLSFSFSGKYNTVKPVLSGHSKRRPKIGLKTDYRLILVKVLQNAPREHPAMRLTFIKLPFAFKNFVLSISSGCFMTGFTVANKLHANISEF